MQRSINLACLIGERTFWTFLTLNNVIRTRQLEILVLGKAKRAKFTNSSQRLSQLLINIFLSVSLILSFPFITAFTVLYFLSI